MKLIGEYTNGNYTITIFDDGTKIRETIDPDATSFVAAFPECMDVKITNKCDKGCAYCHENSTPTGQHGDIMNETFIDTLRPYTELALGGGNVLEHPDLESFLIKLRQRSIIANITVNQDHFIQQEAFIKRLMDEKLVYGVGVSVTTLTESLLNRFTGYPNIVLHIINGVIPMEDLRKMYDRNLKVLILGYKHFRRGVQFYDANVESRMAQMFEELPVAVKHFAVMSFDNLALEQLSVRRLLSQQEWNNFYMGDDGKFTMYIDMVERQFARCSVATQRYTLRDSIHDMFGIILNE